MGHFVLVLFAMPRFPYGAQRPGLVYSPVTFLVHVRAKVSPLVARLRRIPLPPLSPFREWLHLQSHRRNCRPRRSRRQALKQCIRFMQTLKLLRYRLYRSETAAEDALQVSAPPPPMQAPSVACDLPKASWRNCRFSLQFRGQRSKDV